MSVEAFAADADRLLVELTSDLLTGRYTPEPLAHLEISKPGTDEKRRLGLPAVKDKIVQASLAEGLSAYFEPLFSDCSYAYRPGKGSVKAIRRVQDMVVNRKNHWISTLDIDNFFDTVDHATCLDILSKHLSDPGITRLIKLYLAAGILKADTWRDTDIGIAQGSILSPVLSNIYLNEFDQFLHRNGTFFVRYADNFILLSRNRGYLENAVDAACEFLKDRLKLAVHVPEHRVRNTSRGFSFLGIYFHRGQLRMDHRRIDDKIDKVAAMLTHQQDLDSAVTEFNETVEGLRAYYGKLLSKTRQLDYIESMMHAELAGCVRRLRGKNKDITRKACRDALERLAFVYDKTAEQKSGIIRKIVDDAFAPDGADLSSGTAKKADDRSVQAAIGHKRRTYTSRIATETTLQVSSFGHFIGCNKNRFTVKHKGAVVASVPKHRLKRILIDSPGVSLSSNVVHECSERRVGIEFLTPDGTPYAFIYTPNTAISESSELQLKENRTPRGFELACQFLRGKAKNQINLLTYLNKYIRRVEPDKGRQIAALIREMKGLVKKLDPEDAPDDSRERIMGTEGSISRYYWNGVQMVLSPDVPFEKRVTYRAKDPVNAAINYGYGILYQRVKKALSNAGAALHVSFLHQPDGRKPTLVFDLIEEFRQFFVDRTILAMFNRQEPIELDGSGLLTTASRRLIAANVIERLESYTKWSGKRYRCEEIIAGQANRLIRHLRGELRYRPFIGRY